MTGNLIQPKMSAEWLTLNRQLLMGELAGIYHRLQQLATQQQGQTYDVPTDLSDQVSLAERLSSPSGLQQLSQLFNLSAFEQEILLLCAGAELSIGWGRLCAQAQGKPRLQAPTFELANILVERRETVSPHWSAFSAAAPLRFWHMIEVGPGDALMTSPLRIDERILRYLLGLEGLDARLVRRLKSISGNEHVLLVPSHQKICDRIVNLWRQRTPLSQPLPIVQLWGSDFGQQRGIATAAAKALNLSVCCLRTGQLPHDFEQQQLLIELWKREARLSPMVLIVECDALGEQAQQPLWRPWLEVIETPLVLIGREASNADSQTSVSYEVNAPTREEQHQLWQESFSPTQCPTDQALQKITDQFCLSAQQIQAAALQTMTEVSTESPTVNGLFSPLWNSCRTQTRPRLDDLAERLPTQESWDDLVLPEAQSQTLAALIACLRSQHKVYTDWGFAEKQGRGLGMSALFSGISGTGKTMAAGAIAHTLQLDLYRIDLSSVVSKYIGETEKNLRQVFDAAESGSVVLLFDEADALFGKRSDVRDSRDRYANMEVSYLLQRMESYQGLAILTTNLKESIDPAFMRRLRFIVKFPAPDFDQRLAIWQRIFPTQTPTENLNYRKLAKLNVTGGLIRNIALTAAFLAADSNKPVAMAHVLQATQSEYSKLERPVPAMEVKGWVA